MKKQLRHLFYFIILIIVDQVSKYLVSTNLKGNEPIPIIPKVLRLEYLENTGAVWGIFKGQVFFLSILTSVIFIGLIYLYFKIPKDKKFNALKIVMVFLMAGAVGNMIDRITIGYVVDFIYFELINFPVFNLADCYVSVTAVLLVLLSLFYYKEDDFAFLDQIFSFKKKKKDTE